MIPENDVARLNDRARIMIADDHDLARAGLKSMLSGEHGLDIVGEATNGEEAVRLCRELRPDLILMDVRMPIMDGLAATREIKKISPRTTVVIVTMHEDENYLFEALKAGAAGYLLKDQTQREVVRTVRQVLRGESLLNPTVSNQLLRRLVNEISSPTESATKRLTAREVGVLKLIAQGKTNAEIARDLNISPGTVKVHVERIISKLGVSDRTQAAVRAVAMGLVTPSSE
ncbi:MAG TPA: response regulator transcription factor [Chloroflexota bacterium]|nr:response regulator transcription factor [Chloroflexota bacterium]